MLVHPPISNNLTQKIEPSLHRDSLILLSAVHDRFRRLVFLDLCWRHVLIRSVPCRRKGVFGVWRFPFVSAEGILTFLLWMQCGYHVALFVLLSFSLYDNLGLLIDSRLDSFCVFLRSEHCSDVAALGGPVVCHLELSSVGI